MWGWRRIGVVVRRRWEWGEDPWSRVGPHGSQYTQLRACNLPESAIRAWLCYTELSSGSESQQTEICERSFTNEFCLFLPGFAEEWRTQRTPGSMATCTMYVLLLEDLSPKRLLKPRWPSDVPMCCMTGQSRPTVISNYEYTCMTRFPWSWPIEMPNSSWWCLVE